MQYLIDPFQTDVRKPPCRSLCKWFLCLVRCSILT